MTGRERTQLLDRMPDQTYSRPMPTRDKPVVWLRGEIKTPPFSSEARIEAGFLLRRLQRGETLSLPHARPMPGIGVRCQELRIRDQSHNWRIVIRVDADAVVVIDVFDKKTPRTPNPVIDTCRRRLRGYDALNDGGRK